MNTPTPQDAAWARTKVDALFKKQFMTLSQLFLLMARCAR